MSGGHRTTAPNDIIKFVAAPSRTAHLGRVPDPAFWGTVESLSRLTNASSALASAVRA